MYFHMSGDRLIVEAANPAEGFWLRTVLDEITTNGFDCRNDVHGDVCRLQIPLRKRGDSNEEENTVSNV